MKLLDDRERAKLKRERDWYRAGFFIVAGMMMFFGALASGYLHFLP